MLKSIFKILLYPISILYGLTLYIRNKFYDLQLFNSTQFNIPVISIGNLSLGGTGKTPHIEYLVKLLKDQNKIATISRGYKRNTKGFVLANEQSTANDIGDEPLQFKTKFKNLIVAVDEKRVNGIKKVCELHPTTNLILLDDAYQHRAVSRTTNILLSEYKHLYCDDFVIPSGRLREFKSGSKRADIIIVTKSPKNITDKERKNILTKLAPKDYQSIYFTSVKYGKTTPFTLAAKNTPINNQKVILLTGIAKPSQLIKEVESTFHILKHLKYSDHHSFSKSDINHIINEYNQLKENNIIVISTEKDIMRLSLPTILKQLEQIPIFYIPIEIEFSQNDKEAFDKKILKDVK